MYYYQFIIHNSFHTAVHAHGDCKLYQCGFATPLHVIAQPITAISCVVQGRRPIAEWYNMQAISCILPVDCVHPSMSVYITVLILRMVCQWCKQPCGPAPPSGECCRQWWGPWENDGDTRPARDCSALPDDNYLAGSENRSLTGNYNQSLGNVQQITCSV